MKRGLKVSLRICIDFPNGGYNHCPDEKGTESPRAFQAVIVTI